MNSTRLRPGKFKPNGHPMTDQIDFGRVVMQSLRLEGAANGPAQQTRIGGTIFNRDPLTATQLRMVSAAVTLIQESGCRAVDRVAYAMELQRFAAACPLDNTDKNLALAIEIEKMLRKGVWLFDEQQGTLTRSAWFQSIELDRERIVFRFAERILPLAFRLADEDAEYHLVKGIQYKGKHTAAVFNIVWSRRDQGLLEYSIPELMRHLSLENTRYSYGQLKLRVLEPAFEEIYAWDEALFVRFGPTFSGRRVEGVWLDVTTGEKARELRKAEPEFRIASPEQKPAATAA